MALRWYAARTKPLAEYAARERLETAGLDVLLPCAQGRAPRRGHQDTPLFPGYLFLRYDLEQQGWDQLRRVPQLMGLVAFEGVVPSVPDEVMYELAQRIEAMNGNNGLWNRFHPGQRVRVTLGPTESLAEVVEEAQSPHARVRVLVEFLGRLVEARVPWRHVQATGADGFVRNWNRRTPRRTRGRGRWIRGYGPNAAAAQGGPDDSR